MSVDIPNEHLSYVQEAVASGRFKSETALVGEALRLLREQEELPRTIQHGFDQISQGECIELDEEELDEYFDALIQGSKESASTKRTA